MVRLLRSSGSGRKQPAKAQAEQVGVKPEVRRLDVVIGHVKVAVLQNNSPLRPEEVLDPKPGLGIELSGSAKFGSSKVEGRIEDPGSHIEERYRPPPRLSIQPEQQDVTGQSSSRVGRPAQHPLIDDFKTAQRNVADVEIGDDDP